MNNEVGRDADDGTVLSVAGVAKTFGGVKALIDVSLELRSGEVHCLAGENGSGKSTLIKVISGAERPDAGTIAIGGTSYSGVRPDVAIKAGVQVIYQDFSLFPNLTVGENILFTSAVADGRRRFSLRKELPQARAVIEELGLDLDLNDEVEALSVADKQLTAICRALVHDAKVIVMDEPTTALTHTEVTRLFAIVDRLKAQGVALMFVSHKVEEMLKVSDRVTIMRSGSVVSSGPASEYDGRRIARDMTGHEVLSEREISAFDGGAGDRLAVEGLSRRGYFKDISFTVGHGEILGITGLLGSGRTEIAEALFGVMPHDSGTIAVDGSEVSINSVQDAIAAGVAYVPEDRLTQGLFLEKSIADNMIAASVDKYRTRGGTIGSSAAKKAIDALFARLRIKAPTSAAPVRSLSGGNAQRVVLAKWVANEPKILILNGPTVGVDIGSKAEILTLLREQAAAGMGVIVISDDAPELVSSCHRVLVVHRGRIAHELTGDDVNDLNIREKVSA
ncbi:sugar ABC transporter ATP-binding protein [Demequina sp. SO4-18]|uniref:sugar ABC transporter ATP-binding protein n=1 Tax=Demequina sp. SO4-18 TaxID=3401026 RepID=UPI003B5B5AE8